MRVFILFVLMSLVYSNNYSQNVDGKYILYHKFSGVYDTLILTGNTFIHIRMTEYSELKTDTGICEIKKKKIILLGFSTDKKNTVFIKKKNFLLRRKGLFLRKTYKKIG